MRREAGVAETVTPPAPATARSQRSRRTTQAATNDRVSPFYRCSQHRRTRSERKVVTDRAMEAWYHSSMT
jgi:hypothetical protein